MTSILHPRSPILARSFRTRLWAFGFLVILHPASLLACAACYGKSDSPMALGMNWGIFSLLGVVVVVLSCVAGFFLYLARRSARLQLARVSVSANPELLGLPRELNFSGASFLPTRPEPRPRSARVIP